MSLMSNEKRFRAIENTQANIKERLVRKVVKLLFHSCGKTPWIDKISVLKFREGQERPMQFSKDFEVYVSAIGVKEGEIHYAILSCLTGIARERWNLLTQDRENLDSFRLKFTKKFWNANIQHQVSRNLKFGWYDPT